MSVRQRAVDLLYAMCDRSNAEEIVSEMLSYLETADYSIREEMVGFEHTTASKQNCGSCLELFMKLTVFYLGVESCHTGREIRSRLHVVCGHYFKPHQDSW